MLHTPRELGNLHQQRKTLFRTRVRMRKPYAVIGPVNGDVRIDKLGKLLK